MYSTVFFWTLHTNDFHCNAIRWFLGIGFSLTYGALFARIYRIGQIFLVDTLEVFKVTNMMIIPIVAGIVAIEVVFLSIWTIVSRSRAVLETAEPFVLSDDYFVCTFGDNDKIFFSIIAVFNIGIIIYGLYWAVRIWKLKSVLYNESKIIGFSVYTLAFFIAILGIVQVIGGENRTLTFVLRSGSLVLGPFITVLALVIPRMHYMLQDTETSDSKRRTATMDLSSVTKGSVIDDANGDLKQQVKDLKEEVKYLKSKLKEDKNDEEDDKTADTSIRD
mmetsp:Transcript_22714/g.25281  ORF Transcript_22714/g.25281 Transcript_22714/m.25281 type:complete len:276 (+) Transcript_22714:36-863(+)